MSSEDACEKMGSFIKWFKGEQEQESWSHPKGIFYRKTGMDPKGRRLALFPGQGSQYVNMGRELALNFPTVPPSF